MRSVPGAPVRKSMMEISEVKKRVMDSIARAKSAVQERRVRVDEAAREYDAFLEHVAVPIFRQVANVLRAEGYPFNVFTPGGSVRLTSDKSAEDFIELRLDTEGDRPRVVAHSSHSRGRRVQES